MANNDGALLGIATADDVDGSLNPQLFGAIASNLWKNFEESGKYADKMEFQFVHVEVSHNRVVNYFMANKPLADRKDILVLHVQDHQAY